MDFREAHVSELFKSMDRVRRAWLNVTPGESLSKSQFATLMAICHYGKAAQERPVTLSALAGSMHQSLPALSQRIKALEEAGYVERVPDPDDRRVTGVRLTAKGSDTLSQARLRFNAILSDAVDHMGPESSARLISLLSELAEGLEAAVAAYREEQRP